MKVQYDPNKNQSNLKKHGIDFEQAKHFDFNGAIEVVDDRHDYNEIRYYALGYIGNRLHALVYSLRDDSVRVISLRKANKREVNYYAKIKE